MAENDKFEETVYTIPTNYTDSSRILGIFETRNMIEGLIVALPLVGLILLIFKDPFWIIFLITMIPFPILLLLSFGIRDESFSKFMLHFIKQKMNRRIIVYKNAIPKEEAKDQAEYKTKVKKQSSFDAFLDKIMGSSPQIKDEDPEAESTEQYVHPSDSVQSFLPIKEFRDGLIITKDGRYVKILEVTPINFLLRSGLEREGIIYSYRSFLKVAPRNMQIRIVSKSADITDYLEKLVKLLETERDKKCREHIVNYINHLNELRNSEAVTRKFYLIFQFDKTEMALRTPTHDGIVARVNEETNKIIKYFDQMGNSIVIPDNWDYFNIDVVESITRKNASREMATLEN